MKTYRNYNDLPATAVYIGDALDLACLHNDDGSRHYFDLAMETTKC